MIQLVYDLQESYTLEVCGLYMGVSENREHSEKPNGFADHYPYEKWLFHWEYTLFSIYRLYTRYRLPIYLYYFLY